MSKLISLTLNKKFGVLEAQRVEFTERKDGLIEIKAPVGSGKTTLKEAGELAVSAGNGKVLNFDPEKYPDLDVEIEITGGIFLRTYRDKNGGLKSVAYTKGEDGKVNRNPVINGKAMTAAGLRDLLRTHLTFGIDRFLSENPKIHMEFMMEVYEDKLASLGVIFDKNSPAYKDSILWRLEQAKMERQNKHYARRSINGFKEALVAEGWDENNIPSVVDITAIEAEKSTKIAECKKAHDTAVASFYQEQSERKEQLSGIVSKAKEHINTCSNYNANLDKERQIEEAKRAEKVKKHNDLQWEREMAIRLCTENLESLESYGYKGKEVREFIESLPKPEAKITAEPVVLKKIPFTEDGKIEKTAFEQKWTEEVDAALEAIKTLRVEGAKLHAQIEEMKLPEYSEPDLSGFDKKIEEGKASNAIIERWNAYYDWAESDKKVRDIWKEYCEKYAQIDLGVDGLKILVVGDEEKSEIRTHYNGSHDPELFGNKKGEYRLIQKYSTTQRPIIAILMQVYLLKRKLEKNQDALRLMWIECPLDKKTRDVLLEIQNSHDITIITASTGDYTVEGLGKGEFLIENGELLTCN